MIPKFDILVMVLKAKVISVKYCVSYQIQINQLFVMEPSATEAV